MFKSLHNFGQSLMDKPIGDKLLVFSHKILHVCISSQKPRVCQKPVATIALGSARPPGLTMYGSRKNPCPPHGRSLEIPRGRGGLKG